MTREDLFKPPKMAARAMLTFIFVLAGICLAVRLGMFLTGSRTARDFTRDAFVVVSIVAVAAGVIRSLHHRAQHSPAHRMPWIHASISLVMMAALYALIGIAFMGSVWGLASTHLWMIPFLLGGTLIQCGVTRRVGDSLHCPKCEYEFNFPNPDDAPHRCPECGSGWLGLLKKGRRFRSNKLIVWGIVIALGLGAIAQPMWYINWSARFLPTSILFAILYATPGSAYRAWDELASRPLDSTSSDVMARRILNNRLENSWSSYGDKWLEAQMTAGALRPEFVDRYFRDSFAAKLSAPSKVRAGQPISVALKVTRSLRVKNSMGFYFAGYSLDNSPPVGREPKTIWAHKIPHPLFWGDEDRAFIRSIPAPSQPGPHTIHVTFWIVHAPSFNDQLRWLPDGTPARPADTLWFERVDLEQPVTVEP